MLSKTLSIQLQDYHRSIPVSKKEQYFSTGKWVTLASQDIFAAKALMVLSIA
jgi:hypothetical protein